MAKKIQFPSQVPNALTIKKSDLILLGTVEGEAKVGSVEDVVNTVQSQVEGIIDNGKILDNTIILTSKNVPIVELELPKVQIETDIKLAVNGEKLNPNEQGEINIIIPEGNSTNIYQSERQVGTYNYNGDYMPIYSSSFVLNNLPKTVGSRATYTLKDEPLGYGLFLDVDSISVTTGKKLKAQFYNSNYQIEKIYVNDDLHTVIDLICVADVTAPEDLNMLISINYLKYDGNVVEFSVELPSGVSADAVTLDFPKLKYNKKFAFSYITDDSCAIHQFIFSGINQRFVPTASTNFYHLNFPLSPNFTEGFTPPYPLEYTDGAGVKRRFATSVSVWPDKLVNIGGQIGDDVGMFWPWISEKEFKLYRDFGYTLQYHDLNSYGDGVINQENFNKWFTETKNKFLLYINDSPKILAEPNGDHRYLQFVQSVDDIMMTTAQSGDPLIKKAYLHRDNFTLDKSKISVERWFSGETNYSLNVMNKLAEFDTATDLNTIYWLIGSSHRSSEWEYHLFKNINDEYGSVGKDNILFATVDEIYEYWYLTQNATVSKSITGNKVNFKIYVPKMPRFWFNEISCLLSGVNTVNGVTVNSNTDGLSYGISDNKLLVNLNFNDNLIAKAEKYVTAYEASPNKEYAYADAYYMVQALKPSLRQPFLNRLNVYSSAPQLNEFTINLGQESTANAQVSLRIITSGTAPTHYMVSESTVFNGAEWLPFTSNTVDFTLSDGFDVKTLYCKVKNAFGESSKMQATITRVKPELLLLSISSPTQTVTRAVDFTVNYSGLPTHYKIGENSNLSGSEWLPFTSNTVNYSLSSGYGIKTVYLQLRDANSAEEQISGIVNTTLEYVDNTVAILNNIVINNGDLYSSNSTVTVKFNTYNNITHYKIGQESDLASANWVPWVSDTISYNTQSTDKVVTIYAQVKNDTSESAIKNDTINIISPIVVSAITIADGADNFGGYSPKVTFTNTGVPTHYRLAESSTALGTADWIEWNNNIQYTFTSLGGKTIYGQVRNAVSTSTIVNDSIIIVEPPLTLLLGFNNTVNNTNKQITTNGLVTNQVYLAFHTSYKAQQLVDVNGNNFVGAFLNCHSDFYAVNTRFSGMYNNTIAGMNATNPSGLYSLETIQRGYSVSQFGTDESGKKARLSFTLPTGTYRLRVLWNTGGTSFALTNDTTRTQCFYGVFQGDTELAKTICSNTVGFTGQNNTDFNATMTFSVSNSSIPIDFGAWSHSLNNRPAFNLIEISKIG